MDPQVVGFAGQQAGAARQGDHGFFKFIEIGIFQIGVVCQTPLPAAIVVAPAVALPGEVNPLGVAEFIAHKGQIPLTAQAHGQQTDQLVQGHAPVDDHTLALTVHRPVHLFVAQPEHNGLVPHQRLVMGFAVADYLFFGAASGQFIPDFAHVPVVIPGFLQQLDPHVGLAHCQAVVKADAPLVDGQAQPGHGRGILGDGNGVGVDLPDHFIGQLQIGDRRRIGIHGEILVIVSERSAKAVVIVQHRGNPVKPKPVKMIFGLPVFQVGQQEVEHLVFLIIKYLGIPGGVLAASARVEELVGSAVEFVDALPGVFRSMGVDDVQQDGDPHIVGCIDQLF